MSPVLDVETVNGPALRWCSFDEMVWPRPDEAMNALEWRLRYDQVVTAEDRLAAASIVAAYRELIYAPGDKRDAVVRELRAAVRAVA